VKAFLYLTFLLLIIKLEAGTVIQIKDFLCGCAYCKTVDTGEPLDIGRHMVMCHGWREATLKTMKIMELTKKPEVKVEKRKEVPQHKIIREQADEHVNIYNDYMWRQENILHGWSYSTTHQAFSQEDIWLYLEDFGWVWTLGKERKFLYTEHNGWIYLMLYKNTRVMYWYDRRIWMTVSKFKQEYQK
tara:strand:- start:227 stop:787 length:561 start_codon:yes stop_codon:yes gene_type:complete